MGWTPVAIVPRDGVGLAVYKAHQSDEREEYGEHDCESIEFVLLKSADRCLLDAQVR